MDQLTPSQRIVLTTSLVGERTALSYAQGKELSEQDYQRFLLAQEFGRPVPAEQAKVRHLRQVHLEMARLITLGLTNKAVAKAMGMSEQTIRIAKNSPAFQSLLSEMMGERDKSAFDIGGKLGQLAVQGIATLEEILNDDNVEAVTKKDIAFETLDRLGYGKVTRIDQRSLSGALPSEELDAIKQRVRGRSTVYRVDGDQAPEVPEAAGAGAKARVAISGPSGEVAEEAAGEADLLTVAEVERELVSAGLDLGPAKSGAGGGGEAELPAGGDGEASATLRPGGAEALARPASSHSGDSLAPGSLPDGAALRAAE